MPLFKAKIAVTQYVEIPVYAANEAEALLYMSGTEEWKDDGGLDGYDKAAMSLAGVTPVTDPAHVDFEGDWICWDAGDGELEVGIAFYGKPGVPDEEDDAVVEAAWDAYFEAERALINRFDEERKRNDE